MSANIEFEFVAAARRNGELIYTPEDKQLYKYKSQYQSKKKETVRRYICYRQGCKASLLITNRDRCTQRLLNATHGEHPMQEQQMLQLQLKNSIKEEMARPSLQANKVRNVFNAECRKAKANAQLVVYKKMSRNLRRIKSAAMPKAPQRPQDFVQIFKSMDNLLEFGMCESLPDQRFYQTTILETDFSYTLFCSSPMMDIIKNVDIAERHYLVDATFAVVPSCGYKQLLIIYFGYQRHVSIKIMKYLT